MGSALSPSLLLRKPKYVLVSVYINMMKLGNTLVDQHDQPSEDKNIKLSEDCERSVHLNLKVC